MYCRNCGKEVAPNAVVCPSCGQQPQKGNKYCQQCRAETRPEQQVCTNCGAPLAQYAPGELRSRLVAGLLGVFLGWLGVHRFYLGYTAIGVIQIVVTVLTAGLGGLWGFVEGILILAGSFDHDAGGRPLEDWPGACYAPTCRPGGPGWRSAQPGPG